MWEEEIALEVVLVMRMPLAIQEENFVDVRVHFPRPWAFIILFVIVKLNYCMLTPATPMCECHTWREGYRLSHISNFVHCSQMHGLYSTLFYRYSHWRLCGCGCRYTRAILWGWVLLGGRHRLKCALIAASLIRPCLNWKTGSRMTGTK